MTLGFGTDGIRGVANTELSADLAVVVGRVAGRVLSGPEAPRDDDGRTLFVVGSDTRASSSMLAAAVSAGLASSGADVVDVGVAPTAAVAVLTRDLGAAGGAVVSASHNPAPDNGLKFFGASGQKLRDSEQSRIEEALVGEVAGTDAGPLPTDDAVGRVRTDHLLLERYVDDLLASLESRLDGLHVVVDAANGAAFELGPAVLSSAGARVDALHVTPDGANINDGCGATEPDSLAAAVTARGAQLGLAWDGDADRLVAVDENGAVVDGDHILAVLALFMHDKGQLDGDAVVATVMSNVGLEVALRDRGIGVVPSGVGDRNVLVEMEKHDLVLGGEQSGHVILRHLAPTGCGLLTALQLCQVVVETGRPLSDLAAVMTRFPQLLVNVTLADRSVLDDAEAFWSEVEAVKEELGETGRLVVRASGTEPKLRIMAQASTQDAAAAAVERLVRAAENL